MFKGSFLPQIPETLQPTIAKEDEVTSSEEAASLDSRRTEGNEPKGTKKKRQDCIISNEYKFNFISRF